MTTLDVRSNLDEHPWRHLPNGPIETGVVESVGLVPHGAAEGQSIVALLIRTTDGRPFIAQCSLRLARQAVIALAESRTVRNEAE